MLSDATAWREGSKSGIHLAGRGPANEGANRPERIGRGAGNVGRGRKLAHGVQERATDGFGSLKQLEFILIDEAEKVRRMRLQGRGEARSHAHGHLADALLVIADRRAFHAHEFT